MNTPASPHAILGSLLRALPFGPIQQYPANRTLFSQGGEVKSIFALISGITKLEHVSGDGRNSLLGLRYPGNLVGDWWAGTATVYPVSAIALVPCRARELSSGKMAEIESGDRTAADLHRLLLQLDCCKLAQGHLDRQRHSASALLEELLWNMATGLDARNTMDQVTFVMPLTNAQMSDLCGLSETHYKEVRHQLEMTEG